jgi:hypothetical protein
MVFECDECGTKYVNVLTPREADELREAANTFSKEELEMAKHRAEAMWLTLGDKESFAREAQAKHDLWHEAREKLDKLKEALWVIPEIIWYMEHEGDVGADVCQFTNELYELKKLIGESYETKGIRKDPRPPRGL